MISKEPFEAWNLSKEYLQINFIPHIEHVYFYYKCQSANALYGNNIYLSWKPIKIHKYKNNSVALVR
jgi:hypothetical protein